MGKGADGERDVAKFLTNWLTNQQKEYYFGRSPGSGSVSTVTGTNPDLHGDIVSIKEESKFLTDKIVFECKNGYPTTSIDKHLKYGKDDKLKAFGQQVYDDAFKTKKLPVLIYKKKGQSPGIGMNGEMFNIFEDYILNLRRIHIHGEHKQNIEDLYLFDFKEFFTVITPEIFKKEFKEV